MPPVHEITREERVQLRPHQLELRFLPETFDEDRLTVELVAGTGAGVLRWDWDGSYVEVLGLKKGEVRMGRLESGKSPLLDSHDTGRWSGGVRSGVILGVVEATGLRKSASPDAPDGQEIWVRVRFSSRESLREVRQDVRDGVICNASLGYKVFRFVQTQKPEPGKPRTLRAVDWEPYEVSLCAVGAEAYAGTRAQDEHAPAPHPCTIVLNHQERAMPPEDEPTPAPQPTPTTPPAGGARAATLPAPDQAAVEAARQEGARLERERITGIRSAIASGRRAGLTQERADELTRQLEGDTNATPARARELVLEALAGREEETRTQPAHTAATTRGEEELDKLRAAAENALDHRLGARGADGRPVALTDGGRELRGMSMVRLCEEFLQRRGVRTLGMTKMEIARRALTRGVSAGLHGTSDFPNLVANIANKSLQRAYQAQPRTFLPFTRRNDLVDFKPTTIVQLGGSPALQKVNAQGEIKKGTVGEKAESWFLSTYAVRVGFTRQMIVNDDLSALDRIPAGFGAAATATENDLVWALITGNVVMADGVALFHATHANLSTGAGSALAVAGLDAITQLARKQKGIEGRLINVELRHLLVPEQLEVTAAQLVTQIQPVEVGKVNPFIGRFSTITVEPRLGAASAAAWYAAANPDQVDTIQYGYLQGEGEGPRVEEMDAWEVDGMEYRCLHDFGCGAIDFRGLYKSAGS